MHMVGRYWVVALMGAISMCWGCGSDGESPEEIAENSVGVGRWGGDCRDGDTECTDKFGARLCPMAGTGYDGDDLALCEPESLDEGLLLHYGPADHDDPDEVAKYVLEPFSEDENCVYVYSPNDRDVFVDAYHGRMRPNSHHLIVTQVDALPEGVELGEPTSCNQGEAINSRWLLGSQDPQIDIAVDGSSAETREAEPGDPEYGSGQILKANQLLRLDLHYLNTTDEPILREAWVYLRTVEEEKVENMVDMITFFQGAISVPPRSTGVETAIARCRVPSERYVGMVTGHFHENGTRFTVWHEPAGEEAYKIYETFDWDLPGNAFFSDRIDNPEMDGQNVWGAETGYVKVMPGDYINFQCEFDNPTDTSVTLGELGIDQMCNVFGFYYPSDGDVWNCACVGPACL